jgi:hypothetical protein
MAVTYVPGSHDGRWAARLQMCLVDGDGGAGKADRNKEKLARGPWLGLRGPPSMQKCDTKGERTG